MLTYDMLRGIMYKVMVGINIKVDFTAFVAMRLMALFRHSVRFALTEYSDINAVYDDHHI